MDLKVNYEELYTDLGALTKSFFPKTITRENAREAFAKTLAQMEIIYPKVKREHKREIDHFRSLLLKFNVACNELDARKTEKTSRSSFPQEADVSADLVLPFHEMDSKEKYEDLYIDLSALTRKFYPKTVTRENARQAFSKTLNQMEFIYAKVKRKHQKEIDRFRSLLIEFKAVCDALKACNTEATSTNVSTQDVSEILV